MKVKTFGVGLVAGAVVGAAAGMMLDKKHHSKRHNTFRSIGTMIDGVISSF